MKNYTDFTKAEQKQIIDESIYTHEDLESEDPLFIPADEFENYAKKLAAKKLAEDIGAVNKDATWPNNHIDWQSATRELEYYYTTVTVVDEDYLFLSF